MAQYYFDPNDWTVGDNLSTPGFPFFTIVQGGSLVVEVRNDGTNNYLYVYSATSRTIVGFSPAGSVLDGEIYAEQSNATNVNPQRICVRGRSSDGTVTGTASQYQYRTGNLDKVVNNTLNVLGTAPTWARFIRFSVSGTSPTTVKARTWATAGTEPATWTEITDSDAALQSAGHLGLSPEAEEIFYYGIGFGTNGDPAPTTTGPSLTVTPADLPLTPGGTISGTYADYATIPTTLTVSDGTNTITIPTPTITDNGDGTGSFSGTMPALPTTGTANLVLFGDVTVELS